MAFIMKGAPFAKGRKTVAGQSIKNENGKYSDVDTGEVYTDPDRLLKVNAQGFVEDNDYIVNRKGEIKREKKGK